MPITRSGIASNDFVIQKELDSRPLTKETSKARKRSSNDGQESGKPSAKKAKKSKAEPTSEVHKEDIRPRLTTPDLEYDYDRSQLRDPRQTPGRVKRPRREDRELSDEWKAKFFIPEPEKPPGRLNVFQKSEIYEEKALIDPTEMFHHLYVCHKKGPNGSPTYDSAGFQLDWHKVDRWMKPRPYNKNRMVRGMEKAVDKAQMEVRQMYEIFFEGGKRPPVDDLNYEHYMKDHVSKDLGVPIHQITPAYFREWEQKGFAKIKAKSWWREPNEVEKDRAMKMLSGASLRKDI
jgi:hypothetical protein